MAVWGEASYKVKRAIAFRERFTVAELADTTDLVYSQVEQVVQRLIKQGYVRPLLAHELKPGEQIAAQRVGRPRKRYTLTEDPTKRQEFCAGVEAIASAERMSRARERKPSTPHFNRAMQVIEAMERGAEPVSTGRLDEAADLLVYGRDFEGLISEGVEIAQAYYDRAQARLEAQRGNYSKAQELLAQAEEAFRAAGLDEQVQRTKDQGLAFKVTQGLVGRIKPMIERQTDPTPALEDLKRLIRALPSDNYLLPPLQQAIEVIGAAFKAGVRLAAREMQMVSIGEETMGREPMARGVVSISPETEFLTEEHVSDWVQTGYDSAYIYAEGESLQRPIYRWRRIVEEGGQRITEEGALSLPTKGKILIFRKY